MEWYTGFLILLVIFVLWRIAPLFKLLVTPLQAADFEVITKESIEEERLQTLDLAETLLIKHGYKTVGYVKRAPIVRMFDWGIYGLIGYKESTNSWAMAYLEAQQIPFFDWRLLVFTPDHGDHFLVTMSLSEFEPSDFPERYLCEDAKLYLRSDQLDYHDRRIPFNFKSARIEADQALKIFENLYFSGFIETGAVVKKGADYKLSFNKALAIWKRIPMLHKEILQQKMILEKSQSLSLKSETAPENLEYQYAEYLRSKAKGTQSWLGKTSLLLGGAALFGLAFGLHFSFDFALALILVLFIHEAGHLFGMWIFGYKDLQMFFVPLLGALALGKKEHVRPWQEAIVLLLGPVPGYILGVWMLASGLTEASEFLFQFAVISIFINVLNLMPFLPLDGGKLISLALFNRLPKLQLVLHVLSIGAAGYAGLSWGEPVGIVIAVLLIVALPFVNKESRLLADLLVNNVHKQYLGVGQIIERLKNVEVWRAEPLALKWALLDSLSYRLQHANASYASMFLIFVLWLGSLVLPAALSMGPGTIMNFSNAMFFTEFQEPLSTEDLQDQYSNASNPEEKLERGYPLVYRLFYDELPFNRIWKDIEQSLFDERVAAPTRSQYLLQYSSFCVIAKLECQIEFLMAAIELNDVTGTPANEQLPAIFAIANLEQLSDQDRLAYVNKGIQLIRNGEDAGNWYQELALLKSSLLENSGQIKQAENLLLELAGDTQQEPEFLVRPREELVRFYLRADQKYTAVELLNRWIREGQSNRYGIRQNYRYWQVWLIFDENLNEASKLLEQIPAENVLDKAELEMGKLLIKYLDQGYLKEEDTKDLMLVLRRLESFDWITIAEYLLPEELSNMLNEDPEEYYYESFGEQWFEEMRTLLNYNELRAVRDYMIKNMEASFEQY